MIHTTNRHHEELLALPQIIALAAPATLFAWHVIKYGLKRPPASQGDEKKDVDTHQDG